VVPVVICEWINIIKIKNKEEMKWMTLQGLVLLLGNLSLERQFPFIWNFAALIPLSFPRTQANKIYFKYFENFNCICFCKDTVLLYLSLIYVLYQEWPAFNRAQWFVLIILTSPEAETRGSHFKASLAKNILRLHLNQ
jgi:hypothetical protein